METDSLNIFSIEDLLEHFFLIEIGCSLIDDGGCFHFLMNVTTFIFTFIITLVTATGLEPTTTYFVNEHSNI